MLSRNPGTIPLVYPSYCCSKLIIETMLNKTWREKLIWSQLWTELKWEFLPWKLYMYMVLLGKQTAYDSPCSGNLLPCYWVKHQPFLKGQVGIFFQTWWNKSFSCCCKTRGVVLSWYFDMFLKDFKMYTLLQKWFPLYFLRSRKQTVSLTRLITGLKTPN